MNVDDIRTLRSARPFKPFVLVLENGEKLDVDFPFALGFSFSGDELTFISKSQRVRFLRPSDVREVIVNGAINHA